MTASIAITVLSLLAVGLAAATGYFYSKYKTSTKRIDSLEEESEKQRKHLMSSPELSRHARNLLRLREKAEKLRNPGSNNGVPSGDR